MILQHPDVMKEKLMEVHPSKDYTPTEFLAAQCPKELLARKKSRNVHSSSDWEQNHHQQNKETGYNSHKSNL